MLDLLILGIYPHAIEMAEIAQRINRMEPTWNLIGFVSAYGDEVGEELLNLPVLTFEDALARHPTAYLIPEYDWPGRTELPRERLATLIDPSVFVSSTAHIGRGCVIYPNCYVGAHTRIGDLSFCLSGVVINHDDDIGDSVTLTSGVVLAGEVHVEAGCYLGQACTVREKVTIGRGSLIGMGSVVLKNVPANTVVVGNPARRLRARVHNYPGAKVVRAAKQVARLRAKMALQRMRALQVSEPPR